MALRVLFFIWQFQVGERQRRDSSFLFFLFEKGRPKAGTESGPRTVLSVTNERPRISRQARKRGSAVPATVVTVQTAKFHDFRRDLGYQAGRKSFLQSSVRNDTVGCGVLLLTPFACSILLTALVTSPSQPLLWNKDKIGWGILILNKWPG